MPLRLDHIAIAAPDLGAAVRRFVGDLGQTLEGMEEVASQQTATAFLPVPAAHIELVAPIDGKGPIARFLEKRGPGLHHLCFSTDDIDRDVAALRAKGWAFTSEAPTAGAHGCRVIFIHPKSCEGVLIELSEPPKGAHP